MSLLSTKTTSNTSLHQTKSHKSRILPYKAPKIPRAMPPPMAFASIVPDAQTLTYTGLGMAAVSFVGTFFVAPSFKGSFKEPIDWKEIYPMLVESGVRTLTPSEAYSKVRKGAILLDVRFADRVKDSRPTASVSVPLYRPIREWDIPSIIRRLAFAFFGVAGTELNEKFTEEVEVLVPKGKEVIVMCEAGGSIESKPGSQFGFQSRSLKAYWYLQQAGYSNLYHVQGGMSQWKRDDLPVEEGEGEPTEN